jgi:hypothetical protein
MKNGDSREFAIGTSGCTRLAASREEIKQEIIKAESHGSVQMEKETYLGGISQDVFVKKVVIFCVRYDELLYSCVRSRPHVTFYQTTACGVTDLALLLGFSAKFLSLN